MDAILHLEPGTEPITGWLEAGAGALSVAFTGYMELVAVLEQLRAGAPAPLQDTDGMGQS